MSQLPASVELFNLFKFISYTGALTFVPYDHGTGASVYRKRILNLIQQLISVCVFLLLLFMSVFEVVQLVLALWNINGVGELMPSIIWATSFPLALTSQIFYSFKRPILFDFLRRWEEIHLRFQQTKAAAVPKMNCFLVNRMYIIYFVTVCISVALVMIVVVDFPVFPLLPAAYGTIGHVANLPVTCVVFATGLFYAWSLSAVSDLAPSIMYFHLALAVENISGCIDGSLKRFKHAEEAEETAVESEDQVSVDLQPDCTKEWIRQQSDPEFRRKNWQQAWLYYEAVRNLLDETNSQFGLLLLLNHGALFFVASSMIFAILRWFRGMSWLLLLVYGLNAAGTIIRLSSTILLCSRLTATVQKLQSRIIQLVSSSWFTLLRPSERQFFTIFLIRTQDGGTVASPLGLYRITPAMLLTLGSLLVTYLVVLLQSSDESNFENFTNVTGRITGTLFFSVL